MGKRCGFCVKAEALLAPQIASGDIVKKPASEAKGKFNGFPAFEYNGKTHTGCPQSFEHLSKKLGYSKERYHHPGHNPYGYNAMPVRANDSPAYHGQCKNKSYSDLMSCCAKACNNNTQTACYLECEKSGPSPNTCNPPPKGMSRTECCEKGGRVGKIGQCPPGCTDEGGECVPGGGGGSNVRGPLPCPVKGPVICNVNGECEETGLEQGEPNPCSGGCWSPLNEDAILACNKYRGGGGGGGGAKKCSTDDNCGGSNQYCSAKSKECMEVPSTWTQDFYNSHLSSLPSSIPNQAKRCLMNGIAAKYPNPRNVKKDQTTLNEIMNNCKGNPTAYPTPKFSKASGNGGGKGSKCDVGVISGCSDSLYCSVGSKTCKAIPSTWTQDFYNSVVDVVGALKVPGMKMNEDVAKCIINGTAKECNIKNPQKLNSIDSKDDPSCTAPVKSNCKKNTSSYPTSPVKGTSGGKKGISGGEIALIVVGSLALLVLLGVITYYFTHKKK